MLTFLAAVFFLIVTPGPGVLSAAGVGAAYGFRAGMRYITGLCIGQLLVIAAVVSGLAALVLASPVIRFVLLGLSTLYLLYLAARIALAGSKVAFIEAQKEPGVMAGILLQPINPKAYAVNTTLFTGFTLYPDAFWVEVLWKILLLNAIWIPIHVGWVWAGGALKRLDLPERTQRAINFTMAASMLIVVALALSSAF
jgi:threonine/homoserine/homoserine lactone efflux protein